MTTTGDTPAMETNYATTFTADVGSVEVDGWTEAITARCEDFTERSRSAGVVFTAPIGTFRAGERVTVTITREATS